MGIFLGLADFLGDALFFGVAAAFFAGDVGICFRGVESSLIDSESEVVFGAANSFKGENADIPALLGAVCRGGVATMTSGEASIAGACGEGSISIGLEAGSSSGISRTGYTTSSDCEGRRLWRVDLLGDLVGVLVGDGVLISSAD